MRADMPRVRAVAPSVTAVPYVSHDERDSPDLLGPSHISLGTGCYLRRRMDAHE